jgi:hypothetical protein
MMRLSRSGAEPAASAFISLIGRAGQVSACACCEMARPVIATMTTRVIVENILSLIRSKRKLLV